MAIRVWRKVHSPLSYNCLLPVGMRINPEFRKLKVFILLAERGRLRFRFFANVKLSRFISIERWPLYSQRDKRCKVYPSFLLIPYIFIYFENILLYGRWISLRATLNDSYARLQNFTACAMVMSNLLVCLCLSVCLPVCAVVPTCQQQKFSRQNLLVVIFSHWMNPWSILFFRLRVGNTQSIRINLESILSYNPQNVQLSIS